ncbi:hypothetical protein BT69DRAFT_124623 [Atractiella rhizophila]|nr:hypothetical protein BT69DRAFT_124623 [Atractiella rhizophila]
MWRSKLYADAEIHISEGSGNSPGSMYLDVQRGNQPEAVFAAHRAILCSRSPYFRSLLLNRYADSDNRSFTLPSPPFSPASLHFCLGWLYCGTLDFSNRTFDLSTAFEIWRSAAYLSLDLLKVEVERKVETMVHNFKDTCKICTKRAGRVFEFASSPDVSAPHLYEGSKSILTNPKVFGDAWGREVGHLDPKLRQSIATSLLNATNPNTLVDMVKGCDTLNKRIEFEKGPWADHLRTMLEPLQTKVTHILTKDFRKVTDSQYFRSLCDGVGFSSDLLEKVLSFLVKSLTDQTVPQTYQILIGNVLLREDGISMDARALVEDAKDGIIKYLKRRWVNVRQYNAFAALENWALKEISDELEVPVSDLLDNTRAPPPSVGKGKKVERDDTESITDRSLRASVLNRNAARTTSQTGSIRPAARGGTPMKPGTTPRTTSVTSRQPSRVSVTSTSSVASSVRRLRAENSAIIKEIEADRKSLAPSVSSVASASGAPTKPSRSLPTLPPDNKTPSVQVGTTQRLVKRSPSRTSVTSRVSARGTPAVSTPKASKPPVPTSQPSTAKKAPSISSAASVRSVRRPTAPPTTTSTTSAATATATPAAKKAPSITSSARPRRMSAASAKSFASTSTAGPSRTGPPLVAKSANGAPPARVQKAPSIISTRSTRSVKDNESTISSTPRRTVKPSTASTAASIKSVRSAAVTKPKPVKAAPGSALNVGIPCIVTTMGVTKPIKFRAMVRYIGKVLFDKGAWVGVEVDTRLIGKEHSKLKWHDGTFEGVKYFELGTEPVPSNRATSPLPPGFASANSSAISLHSTTKSETGSNQTGQVTKGLFVKASSVLYVL